MRKLVLVVFAVSLAGMAGCEDLDAQYVNEQRLERGLVIILPGIEGRGAYNVSIRQGLYDGGVPYALLIHEWGAPVPIAGLIINQTDAQGNRLAGARVAQLAMNYMATHPGCPVHIIGHSGGGGIAVFTAEVLSPGYEVDGLILLSASISAPYNLSGALMHCRKGILNVYNTADAGALALGTSLLSTVDGVSGESAGLYGFTRSFPGLYQFEASPDLTGIEIDAHGSTTRVGFVSRYLVPWVLRANWPPPEAHYVRG